MRIRWRILAAVHGTVLILVCFSAGYGADPDGAQRAIAKAYKLRMRDPDAAISAYSEAIRLDPKKRGGIYWTILRLSRERGFR